MKTHITFNVEGFPAAMMAFRGSPVMLIEKEGDSFKIHVGSTAMLSEFGGRSPMVIGRFNFLAKPKALEVCYARGAVFSDEDIRRVFTMMLDALTQACDGTNTIGKSALNRKDDGTNWIRGYATDGTFVDENRLKVKLGLFESAEITCVTTIERFDAPILAYGIDDNGRSYVAIYNMTDCERVQKLEVDAPLTSIALQRSLTDEDGYDKVAVIVGHSTGSRVMVSDDQTGWKTVRVTGVSQLAFDQTNGTLVTVSRYGEVARSNVNDGTAWDLTPNVEGEIANTLLIPGRAHPRLATFDVTGGHRLFELGPKGYRPAIIRDGDGAPC